VDAEKQREFKAQLRQRLDARFRGPLMSYFARRIGDRGEAEDLTHEVFVRILATDTRIPIEQADGLIFTIAGNLLRDRHRRHTRRGERANIPLDDETISNLSRDAVEDRDPERVLLARQTLDAALAALDELGERTKDIFVLVRLENMKHREIAGLLGISVSTVEKHVVRATVHLALRFGAEAL
jgi:RNA polymerase sigma factor (sigma-70 family)